MNSQAGDSLDPQADRERRRRLLGSHGLPPPFPMRASDRADHALDGDALVEVDGKRRLAGDAVQDLSFRPSRRQWANGEQAARKRLRRCAARDIDPDI